MIRSIRTKILAGYALAVGLLFVLGALAYANMGRLVDSARMQDHTRQVLESIDKLQLSLTQAESAQRGYLIAGHEEYLTNFSDLVDRAQGQAAALRRLTADNGEQQVRVDELDPLVAAKIERMKALIALHREKGAEVAQAEAALGKGKEIMDNIHRLSERMYATEEALLAKRSATADANVRRFYFGLFGVVPMVAIILLLVGRAIATGISRPLATITKAAERIAAGDPEVELPAEERSDEVGRLATSFRRMSKVLSDFSAVNTRIAQGDLTAVVAPQSASDKFGAAHQEMIQKLSQLAGSVQRAALQVNTSATEIAATSKQQQATATETAATTTEIGATSRQIAATSKELVRTVGEVGLVAEETARLAGGGQAGLGRMESTMRSIMDASAGITSKLAVLNEKATNINAVVITITKVADQTNLLSLNAAIEAEKAGEYGLGFAVVATEIRRLADQTAVATYDIEQTVKEMQSAVSAGVMGMDKFSEEVRRGVEEVRQVGSQLAAIIAQVQSLVPRFEAVNEGMQSQSLGAQQITEALSQLSEAAQQTAESLRNSSMAIEQLNDSARDLQNGVARFKLRA